VALRDPVDELEQPVPPSVEEVARRIGVGFLFAIAGCLFLGQLVRIVEPWWLALGLGAMSAPATLAIRRATFGP